MPLIRAVKKNHRRHIVTINKRYYISYRNRKRFDIIIAISRYHFINYTILFYHDIDYVLSIASLIQEENIVKIKSKIVNLTE